MDMVDNNENEEHLKQLHKYQELDEFYKEKAQGAFVCSRLKWLEDGERNSKYFFNIEKRNKRNSLTKLNINNSVTEDYNIIKYVSKFYKHLYKITVWVIQIFLAP